MQSFFQSEFQVNNQAPAMAVDTMTSLDLTSHDECETNIHIGKIGMCSHCFSDAAFQSVYSLGYVMGFRLRDQT